MNRISRSFIIMLGALMCVVAPHAAYAQNGPDQTARTLTDVAKGLGSCAAQKPEGCLTFAVQFLTGKVGAESDDNIIKDKLDSVSARLNGLSDQMKNLNSTMLNSFNALGLDVNALGMNDANTVIYKQINAIKTYNTLFGFAVKACKNYRKLNADDQATCDTDRKAVAAALSTVFSQKEDINDQLMGFGSPNMGLLYRIWRDAAGKGTYQGPDLAATVKNAYDYYAHVQAMQLVLVAQYTNTSLNSSPDALVAPEEVIQEVKDLQSNLNRQRAMIPPVPLANSFMDQRNPTRPAQWILADPMNYPDAEGVAAYYPNGRVALVADFDSLLASWKPSSGSAALYVAKLILGSSASSSALAEMAARMDTVWTSNRPEIGNREDGDYQIGCETQDGVGCFQVLIHKENYQKLVATLGSARDLNTNFTSISWAKTFDCTPPHLSAGFFWMQNGKPCSWWKYKGVVGPDPNIKVYVTPHLYHYFVILPTPYSQGVLPPTASQ